MKKVLLDSNIILDIAIERRDFYEKSKAVLTQIVNLHFAGYVTASSVTDIYYILKKSKGHEKSIEFLKGLFMFIDIAGVSKEVIQWALLDKMCDFEDAVQVACAKQNAVGIIITRNIVDFRNTGLEIMSPEDFLTRFT